MRRKWVQRRDGKLVEVDLNRKRPPPKFPAIKVDSIQPYFSAHANRMVESNSDHRRVLKEHNLIELGNEWDAWEREVRNPDFTDDGRLQWRDPASEADNQVYEENTTWIQKQAKS